MPSVERYEVQADVWVEVRNLTSTRMTHGLIAYNKTLLAIGGSDGTTSLNSVEEYDPETNAWIMKMSMSTRRSHVASTVMYTRTSSR